VQVAYGDLLVEGQRSLALEAFLQSVNNIGLKRHLLVAEVATMERALRLGNVYFQADSVCRPRVNAQQVEADDGPPPSKAAAAVHVATAASAADEVNLTTSLVRELVAEIRRLWQQPVAKRLVRLPTAAAGRCPLLVRGVVVENIFLGDVPTVGGNGQTSTAHGRIRRPWASVNTSEAKAQAQQGEEAASSEWQAPRRVSRPQGLPKPPAWPLTNCFERLQEEGVYKEWEQD